MRTKKRKLLISYLIADFLTAGLSYTLFFIFRKVYIEPMKFGYSIPIQFTTNFYLGIIVIPAIWLLIYYFSGYYRELFRKSRLQELGQTFFVTLLGVTFIFFLFILDDTVSNYKNYYQSFLALFSLQFMLTWLIRTSITARVGKAIRHGKIGFNTILVGSNQPAVEIYKEMTSQPQSNGYRFIGFVMVSDPNGDYLGGFLPNLGSYENLKEIIDLQDVEEVIIAIDPSEEDMINHIINLLHLSNVRVRAIPSMNDILTGKVKFNTLFDTPLLDVSHDLMPSWQMNIKNFLDITGAALMLVFFSPLFLSLMVAIKINSPGPVFYSHERIGRFGKPFRILKFRSMYHEAEKNGPELSSKNDLRITRIGRFMRQYRLDEIPNFLNVLKGEMSLVGPRPERQYYIDQIVKQAPHYVHLHKVKPGITSWGQVKYGYAENVDEMIRRLRYDILYIENMSLSLDFKIILYTVLTVIKGRGV